MSLDVFFRPQSIAVVGASDDPSSVGHAVLKNLLDGGFPRPVYPVNLKGGEILGQEVFESLSDVGESIDLIVVAIPPKYVPGLLEEAGTVGTRGAVVITAGFSEMGEEGKKLEGAMMDAARKAGIRVVGPNCLGVIRPSEQLNASFADIMPPVGSIGLLSQSGALITGLLSYAERERFGLSAAVSLGAKADVEDEDVLRWLAEDEETQCLAVYVEALKEPRGFYELARELTGRVPVVALKGGTTEAGAKAASSHTGSLAGSEAAYSAAFAQAGVLQAHTIGDFAAWCRALSAQPPAPGPRVAIVTNAGGPGVLTADEASRKGLKIAELSGETLKKLDEVLPAVWSRNNPVDVIGDATPQRYKKALDILGRADEVDSILVILTRQAMTDPEGTAEAICEASDDPTWTKPLVASFLGLAGTPAGSLLDAHGVPEFDEPETAVSALSALVRRGRWLEREEPGEHELTSHPDPNPIAVNAALRDARDQGQTYLDLALARRVLEAAGIRYNRSGTASDADEAVRVAEEIGFPVVVKLISQDVVHKSDVGGVILDVIDEEGVRDACAKIRERVGERQPGARIDGFTVEEQVKGTEIIVGMSRDRDFGPLLMVGMGGVFVEVYEDVAFRLSPLTRRDALDMIDEIEAQPLLDGARERPKLDRGELAEIVLRVSRLVEDVPAIEELDLNPLVLTEDGLVAIDARVVLKSDD